MKSKLILAFLGLGSVAVQAQQYTIATVAGGGALPASAPAASVNIPVSFMTVSSAGDVYFSSNNAVMKVDSQGTLTRIAGTGVYGISADGGSATATTLAWPAGLAIDSAGDLYIAENAAHRVRKVSPQGVITTVAGTGISGYSGDGGPALGAQLNWPTAVALDSAGDLFIADTANQVVRKVSANGIISTLATGFHNNQGVAVDAAGNVYATDHTFDSVGNGLGYLFKITSTGAISQMVGPDVLFEPNGVAVDVNGNIFVADPGNEYIFKVTADGGVSIAATSFAVDLAIDNSGNLYASYGGYGGNVLSRISAAGTVTNLVGNLPSILGEGLPSGNYWGDGGRATDAGLSVPLGVAVDSVGNLYISDAGNSRIRKVAPDGSISTFAGSGAPGFSGDGGPATAAQLKSPSGLAVDSAGNLYIADTGNNRVRKVSTNGTISTVAGGTYLNPPQPPGDGGPATSAALGGPFGVAVDGSGNLYIADAYLFLVRKVSPNGTISTVAGSDYLVPGPTQIGYPLNLAVDKAGDVYIASYTRTVTAVQPGVFNIAVPGQILELSAAGALSTIAGTTSNAVSPPTGDGGPAVNATLQTAVGVALDSTGDIWISGGNLGGFADQGTGSVREITTDGIIHTIVGNGTAGYSGDGGPASQATISGSAGQIAIDAAGNIYFADIFNNVVRVLRH